METHTLSAHSLLIHMEIGIKSPQWEKKRLQITQIRDNIQPGHTDYKQETTAHWIQSSKQKGDWEVKGKQHGYSKRGERGRETE